MELRLKYNDLAPEGLARMRDLEHTLNTASGLPRSLLDFVRLLASLLNGCQYCIRLHRAELRKEHEPDGRIADLLTWRESDAYTERERAAFAWTEAVTNIQQGHTPGATFNEVTAHFTDVEIVNLTIAIASINAWNRLAIALGTGPAND